MVRLAAILLLTALPVAAQDIAPQRVAALETMLIQDCGSCHGLRMTGGLGLPLTPDALADWSDDSLVATILGGRPGTAMPPWEALLSPDDARWMVDRLRQGVTP
ncbi:MAG: cytochrome c [Rhodospirillaceae bacterium]